MALLPLLWSNMAWVVFQWVGYVLCVAMWLKIANKVCTLVSLRYFTASCVTPSWGIVLLFFRLFMAVYMCHWLKTG